MAESYIPKENIHRALEALMGAYAVYGPVWKGLYHDFERLEKPEDLDWDFQNTRLSIKGLIHPHSEKMFTFSMASDDPEAGILKEAPKDDTPRAVVLRPCDAAALRLLDVNFESDDYVDPWWHKRRELTTLIGLACNEPCSTCFCKSAGFGPHDPEALDVLLVDVGDGYLATSQTEKGEALVGKVGDAAVEPPADAAETADRLKKEAEAAMPTEFETQPLPQEDVKELFDSDFWEDVQFSCINCGTCTYLCPTCWCFDIQDEVHGREGERVRTWDSCMYPLFTHHASGHNPRNAKVQRVRQRFMHKFKYYIDKYGGRPACVGCGRCVQFCPVNIDIREVVRMMTAHCVCPT
jgi:ferredoxin